MIRPTMSHALNKDDLHELMGKYASYLEDELAKANERVRGLESVLDEMRNSFYSRFLDYRGLTIEQACKHCSGSGVKVYGNTSTWRMGIGGQMITPDVCDNCWGSGNADKPWANLRQLRKEQEK